MTFKECCSQRTKKDGFTIMEIAICIAIILAIYAGVSTNGIAMTDAAMTSKAKSEAAAIGNALAQYSLEMDAYPEKLDDLLDKQGQYGPWLRELPDADPWGNPYQYKYTDDTGFVIYSYGADETDSGSSVDEIKDGDIGFIDK